MNFSLDMVGLVLLLPEVLLLSTFPFLFFRIARDGAIGSSCFSTLACIISGLGVLALYFVMWIGSGMSGGGAGSPLGNRLIQSPIQVGVSLLVFPMMAVWLAMTGKGTLGLWVFAMFTVFLSYWAGQGWILADMDWWFTITVAVVGGLCGLAAGFLLSRRSQPQRRSQKVLLWSGVGVISAAAGMLASWLTQSLSRRPPIYVDPLATLNLLIVVALVWLFLSTLAALGTGYIKLGRGSLKHTSSAAPDQAP